MIKNGKKRPKKAKKEAIYQAHFEKWSFLEIFGQNALNICSQKLKKIEKKSQKKGPYIKRTCKN
jgi:hypothetical protein